MSNIEATLRALVVFVPVSIAAFVGDIQMAILIAILALFVEMLTIETKISREGYK
jgi:hypothetical protein